jgi:hypothetical protein
MFDLNLDPAKPPPSVIERAYQLSRSGKFANIAEVCERLHREGYRELFMHFEGAALRADLSRICREAQSLPKQSKGRNLPRRHKTSRVHRFGLKAAECRQLADNAQHSKTRQIHLQLARSYEQLATHKD